jgi:hypothetical protein
MKRKESFQAVQSLSLENSFGVLKQEENVILEVTVGINSEDYGWFEVYDEQSGGDDWYAEGGLEIEGKSITGYDGVFSLPNVVIDKLKEWGYDCSEVE